MDLQVLGTVGALARHVNYRETWIYPQPRVKGVYIIRDERGHIRYIGQSDRDIVKRVRRSHVFKYGIGLDWTVCVRPGTKADEQKLIEQYQPELNFTHTTHKRPRAANFGPRA